MAYAFGQLIDHDIDLTSTGTTGADIAVPTGDATAAEQIKVILDQAETRFNEYLKRLSAIKPDARDADVQERIAYLAAHQGADGFWDEPRYTATGFPRVFYLRYHGYPKFFPLWAMARFRNLQASNTKSVLVGM